MFCSFWATICSIATCWAAFFVLVSGPCLNTELHFFLWRLRPIALASTIKQNRALKHGKKSRMKCYLSTREKGDRSIKIHEGSRQKSEIEDVDHTKTTRPPAAYHGGSSPEKQEEIEDGEEIRGIRICK